MTIDCRFGLATRSSHGYCCGSYSSIAATNNATKTVPKKPQRLPYIQEKEKKKKCLAE